MSMNGNDELPIDVTNAFEHDEITGSHGRQVVVFPLKFYEGYQLRINEVFQKAAEALEALLAKLKKENRRPPSFLQPCNFRFTVAEGVSKGRYTGFAVKVEIVNRGMSLEEAKNCEKTRRLLAPEILAGGHPTPTSASYSLFRMYYDALKSKMTFAETRASDDASKTEKLLQGNQIHFVEKVTMHKGPVKETGWWELNPFVMKALLGGLEADPEKRLPIEAFTRLFKRTTDGRYVDSRMCVDAFDRRDYAASREVDWFELQQSRQASE